MESWRPLSSGIGKVDITPPLGLPLFGYFVLRTGDAAGVRTRLYARALYLEDARGEHVVLAADLGAISALLHLQVARAIVQETGISGSFAWLEQRIRMRARVGILGWCTTTTGARTARATIRAS